jgi:hypothetical protein
VDGERNQLRARSDAAQASLGFANVVEGDDESIPDSS